MLNKGLDAVTECHKFLSCEAPSFAHTWLEEFRSLETSARSVIFLKWGTRVISTSASDIIFFFATRPIHITYLRSTSSSAHEKISSDSHPWPMCTFANAQSRFEPELSSDCNPMLLDDNADTASTPSRYSRGRHVVMAQCGIVRRILHGIREPGTTILSARRSESRERAEPHERPASYRWNYRRAYKAKSIRRCIRP